MTLCASVLLMYKFQTSSDGLSFEGGSAISKPSTLEYYCYFFTRRTLFLLIIFMYNQNLQMTFLLILNCFSFMYIGYRKPFSRGRNRMELFNEFMVHIITFHMIFFAGLVHDKEV